MSPDVHNPKFSEDALKQIAWRKTRYPTKQAALMPVLHIAQAEFGWLSPEVMALVAKELDIPAIEVLETATFYTMYHKKPVGKACVYLCTNISCFLNGADELKAYVEGKLGVKCGETTADGRISLFEVECLANCDKAPTAQIDDDYHDNLDPKKMDELIDKLPR
jgi:NADH-quinone oxidoreductase subunit E